MNSPRGVHILFLDGECLFCRRCAYLLHRLDRSKKIHFSALQGETAKILPREWRLLADQDGTASGSVVLAEDTASNQYKFWQGADAILRALFLTRGLLALCWILHYIPACLKNAIYKRVAGRRHLLASEHEECPLQTAALKDVYLP
jgi:predicted DCC family thiol-disulfide oxidoreductase YuxK